MLFSGVAPHITSPVIFGVRPGSPFLFDVTASGDHPMTFSAAGLPAGLALNPTTGMITGSLPSYATYDVALSATNSTGTSQQALRIVVGDKIELTPAMGWNSWTAFTKFVTDADVRAQAAAMVSTGLANYGWNYINIDAGWEGGRTGTAQPLQGNASFPDMAALASDIHSLDLKFGVYTVPEPYGFVGDAAGTAGVNIWPDAQEFGQWGVDYLKYDGNPPSSWDIEEMNQALKATGRDIMLSISYYGGLKVNPFYPQWSESWRVAADITDFYSNVLTDGVTLEDPWDTSSSPGHWNDPDNLLIGDVVGTGDHLHGNGMSLAEQQSQMSVWSMDAAPLLIGSDLTQITQPALDILTNSEVIAVDQDPLGIQSVPFDGTDQMQYRPLADGSIAVEMINYGNSPATFQFNLSDVGLSGPQIARDLWTHQDIGTVNGTYTVSNIPVGGSQLITLRPATAGAPRITYEPISQDVNVGAPATFLLTASGAGALNYQWTRNGVAIPGANSAVYTTASTTAADNGATYRCIVSNSVGRVISYVVDLRVHGLTTSLSDGSNFSNTSGYYNNTIQLNSNVEGNGNSIVINGVGYAKGLGTQADSTVGFLLARQYATFDAVVGLDRNQPGTVEFQVWLDGEEVYTTGPVTGTSAGIPIHLNVQGARIMELVTVNRATAQGLGEADWANLQVTGTPIVNDDTLPTVSPFARTIVEDGTLSFAAADFTGAFSDPVAGQSLQYITAASFPSHGTLLLNNVPLTANQNIPLAQINLLKYVPANHYIGDDAFNWNATDQRGFALAPAKITISVAPPAPPSAVPIAPILLSADAQSSSTVALTWSDPSIPANFAASYTLYVSTNGVDFNAAASAGAGETSATINGLFPATLYWFKIIGTNTLGNSLDSNLQSTSTQASAPIILLRYIDDRDAGWSAVGNWGATSESIYYGGDHSFAIGGNGADVATWTFTNLVPGRYRISATWRGDTNRATNSPFTVLNGSAAFPVVRINQQLAPAGLSDQGFSWSDLGGPYNITGTTLSVRLSDDANQYVDADAIRIERLGDLVFSPVMQVASGTTPLASGASVNFGATPPGTPLQRTFTVTNAGTSALSLGAINLPAGFSLAANFGTATLQPAQNTTFTIQLDAAGTGNFTGQLSFTTNDPAVPTFSLALSGSAAVAAPPPVVLIIDDNDAGFAKSGNWGTTVEPGRYFGDDHSFAKGGGGTDFATYTFTGLTPGAYRVSATWRGDTNRATNAPFTIADGASIVGSVTINQQQQPASLTDQGFSWGDLGTFNITGTTLVVTLRDTADANLYVDADAIRIERTGDLGFTPPPPNPVFIVDDHDAGWSAVGNWGTTYEPGRYYGDDHSFAIGGQGSDVATWTFTGLAPGQYKISATWRGDTNRATNAPFTVLDGATALATILVNQQNPPSDFTDQGSTWSNLGTFTITATTLTVRLTDNADLYVDADAIRIERVGDL